MEQQNLGDPLITAMEPGDIFGVISDGIYEYENESGVQFGQAGLARIMDNFAGDGMDDLVREIMKATYDHGGTVPQADDITIVLIRRLPN